MQTELPQVNWFGGQAEGQQRTKKDIKWPIARASIYRRINAMNAI